MSRSGRGSGDGSGSSDDLPAQQGDGDLDRSGPTTPQPPRQEPAELEAPGGLLGLLLWPLRAAISLGLQIFAAFVNGVLGALLPGRRDQDDAGPDGPPADGGDGR